ncbi:MAG: hypothetical protein AAF376_16610 [Pseudomonadota bacterium]
MDGADTHQTELLCRACGGQTRFDPEARGLKCTSCGTVRDLSHPDDARAADEAPYDPDRPCTEAQVIDGTHVHACQTCGGEVVFTGASVSDRCPYCDGAVVLGPEGASYPAMALIPFDLGQSAAPTLAQFWASRRIAAPSDLERAVAEGRVAGLYAPFWTFDSEEAVTYWARYNERGRDKVRVKSIRGRMTTHFDDLLVPASHHVTPLIRDGILHDFQPERLRAFQPGFLAGFAAERHHQTVAEGLRANEDDKGVLMRNRIKRYEGRHDLYDIGYRTDTTGIHYRRILLPVWIVHYQYRDKPYKIVVSGIDGRTFGERPFSMWKLAGYAGLLTALTMAVGVAWGALAVM